MVARQCRPLPLIPELGRQRQVDFFFFNSRPAWSAEGAPGQPEIHRQIQSSTRGGGAREATTPKEKQTRKETKDKQLFLLG